LSYTPLFVELFVIGVGTAIWLSLTAAAIFQYEFGGKALVDSKLLVALVLATIYVLGIVTDRLARDLFMSTIEALAKYKVVTDERFEQLKAHLPQLTRTNLTMELEKFVRANSLPLAEKIDYNRSRLRICRSWILHFILIGLAFLAWNLRVRVVDVWKTVSLLAIDVVLAMLTLQTTIRLAEDHQKDLLESFSIVVETKRIRSGE
jgi:hypothetical protein